jgi:hypothetical protein
MTMHHAPPSQNPTTAEAPLDRDRTRGCTAGLPAQDAAYLKPPTARKTLPAPHARIRVKFEGLLAGRRLIPDIVTLPKDDRGSGKDSRIPGFQPAALFVLNWEGVFG